MTLALLLVLALPQTRYATVFFRNGGLWVERQGDSVVMNAANPQTPPRGVRLPVPALQAFGIGVSVFIGAHVIGTSPDTVRPYEGEDARIKFTARCAQGQCWMIFVNAGRLGFWRPAPNLTIAQVMELAGALRDAGLKVTRNPYTLDLR